MAARFDVAVEATVRELRHSRPLRTWLQSLRWCGNAIRQTADLAVKDRAVLVESGSEAIVFFLVVATDPDGRARPVHLPLSIASVRLDPAAFALEANQDTFYVMEGERRESYARFVIDAFRRGAKIRTGSGDLLSFRAESIDTFRGVSPVPGGDTSNVLVRISTASGEIVLKSYKFLDTGNREPEILSRLRTRKFPHAARLIGEMVLGRSEDRLVLGMMTEHVDSVDLFTWMRDAWHLALSGGAPSEELVKASRTIASDLGQATASLHNALIDGHPGPWQAEVFTSDDFRVAFKTATQSLRASLRRLKQLAHDAEPLLAQSLRGARTLLLGLRVPIEETLGHLQANVGGVKGVVHSDLHLAQVLRASSDGRLLFIDFEGESERAPEARARKLPPLRDVGTMVRSFAYVRHYVMRDFIGDAPSKTVPSFEPDAFSVQQRALMDRLIGWEGEMVERFCEAYLSRSALYRGLHRADVGSLVRGWALEKALYELEYELKHRIENFPIPVDGIAALVASGHGS